MLCLDIFISNVSLMRGSIRRMFMDPDLIFEERVILYVMYDLILPCQEFEMSFKKVKSLYLFIFTFGIQI